MDQGKIARDLVKILYDAKQVVPPELQVCCFQLFLHSMLIVFLFSKWARTEEEEAVAGTFSIRWLCKHLLTCDLSLSYGFALSQIFSLQYWLCAIEVDEEVEEAEEEEAEGEESLLFYRIVADFVSFRQLWVSLLADLTYLDHWQWLQRRRRRSWLKLLRHGSE